MSAAADQQRSQLGGPASLVDMVELTRAFWPETLAALVATVVALRFPPTDFRVFYAAGANVMHGLSPYADAQSAVVLAGHAFVYPLPAAFALGPLALLPFLLARILFTFASCLAAVIALRLLDVRLGRWPLVLVACSSPMMRSLELGTVNGMLLLLVALCYRYRDRAAVVGSALSALILIKLFLVPLAGWLLVTRRFRALGVAVAVSISALGASMLVVQFDFRAYARLLASISDREAFHSRSLASLLHMLGIGAASAHSWSLVAAAVVCLAGVVTAGICHDERSAFIGCWAGAMLASPIVWYAYGLLLIGLWVSAEIGLAGLAIVLAATTIPLAGFGPQAMFTALALGALPARFIHVRSHRDQPASGSVLPPDPAIVMRRK